MRKIIFIFFISLLFANVIFAQMSDMQVIEYVKQYHALGTSEEQIALNLMKRGVSRAQMERIKKEVEVERLNNDLGGNESSSALRRERRRIDPTEELTSGDLDIISSEISSGAFGRSIFNAKNLTFSPNINIPTPVDYHLGPGDEVVIDIWGASQNSVRQTISPEGRITVDRLGPIYLSGMTVKEANDYVQQKFSEVYAGLGEGVSQIQLTIGQIRTIQINVMGEVVIPGTYSISSLSSVFHALYRAGGVNNIGSLRSVGLFRNNKLLRTMDVYEFLLNGKLNEDIRMTDGDVIIVPPYISLVNISGNVKRPELYELKKNETVADLIHYAGGFQGDAYTKKMRVTRNTNGENQIFTVLESDYGSFKLKDKDVVTISSGLDLFENRVEVLGAIYRPGYYEIGKEILTVKDLVFAADSIRGDAFLNRAILTREKEDFTTEILSVDLGSILFGDGHDIVLRKNDMLYVPSVNDLKEYGDFVIFGAVARPGSYKYSENTTLEDLIVQAGGLLESASTVRVDIARRIIDPKSTMVNNTLSETFILGIKDGFVVDAKQSFILEPYDQVYIRRSPSYHVQRNVYLEGEVVFPGDYVLNKKTERVSDVIKKAGDLTPDAYAEGARLIRQRSEEEIFRTRMALKMASGEDSIAVNTLNLSKSYSVGIDLGKALQNPGSDYDLVLQEGDHLIVPEYENTVRINGAVMYPNTVSYKGDENVSYYINQAGGYLDNAKKSKMFVIYVNGSVSKVKRNDKQAIQPGCEIIIPTKNDKNRITWTGIAQVSTSVVSMASVLALLINALNK
jgi:protein involved in polysaccharide export with SLBB domain